MKKILSLILIIGAVECSRAIATDTNESVAASCDAEISIKIKEPTKEIKTNEPVVVEIQIENTSTNEILMFLMENEPSDFTWSITSPSDKNLSPTNSFPSWGSASFLRIKPLETKQIDFDLSSICNFNEIGTYKVFVKKEIFFISPMRKKCEIISSPLNIVISK